MNEPIKYIPFLKIHPEIKRELFYEFEEFYNDQNYILGSGLEKFEKEYAKFNEVDESIGVGNGHDALLIILKSLEIGAGDEVIIPAHTFFATALSVVNARAKPVLVDIDKNTLCIDPRQIASKITKNTKAIVPVHLYGNPADLPSILTIAQSHNLHLIEDNAQGQGASMQNRKTGSWGVMNFTSFYPTKNIGALGDGGMITTNSRELANRAKALRNYGISEDGEYSMIGINSRLDELQARLLSVKLKYLNGWNNERKLISDLYKKLLGGVSEIELSDGYQESLSSNHIFPILFYKRDELRNHLKSKGINTLIHYKKPIHHHKAFSFLNHKEGEFPVSEKTCREELSLPIYPGLSQTEVKYICSEIKTFLR